MEGRCTADDYTQLTAKYPNWRRQAGIGWDNEHRDGKFPWSREYALTAAELVLSMYKAGVAFYTRDGIRSLEFQILKNMHGKTEEQRNTYSLTGVDQSEYRLVLPEGHIKTNDGMSFSFMHPIVMFSPIQALILPCSKGWDARKATLPIYVSKWCVRDGLPDLPVLPVEPYYLIHSYPRRDRFFVESEIEVVIMTMKQRPEWRDLMNRMAAFGLTPAPDIIKKIVLFFDGDVMRSSVPRNNRRDAAMLAFAVALARTIGSMQGGGGGAGLGGGNGVLPIYVSESMTETPLPRDRAVRDLLLRLGVSVVPSDAQLLLEADDSAVVMDVGIDRIPVHQVVADLSLRGPNSERYFFGPPMIVRTKLRDDIDDFAVIDRPVPETDLPEPKYVMNPDSPRTRAMMKGYESLPMPDPLAAHTSTAVYLRSPLQSAFPPIPAEPFVFEPADLQPTVKGDDGDAFGQQSQQQMRPDSHTHQYPYSDFEQPTVAGLSTIQFDTSRPLAPSGPSYPPLSSSPPPTGVAGGDQLLFHHYRGPPAQPNHRASRSSVQTADAGAGSPARGAGSGGG